MKEKVIKKFDDLFDDDTKNAVKIKKEDYLSSGKNIIIDQNSCDEYGYTNINDGIYKDVPTIVFGDHTRVVKYVEKPFFLGADGAKIIKQKNKDNYIKYLYYYLKSKKIENLGYSRHYKLLKELSFEICEKDEQKKIIFVLDCINNIKDLYQSQLKNLDLLVKSRFVEMFGDIVYNDKKWETEKLNSVCPFNKYNGDIEEKDGQVWILNLDMVESNSGRVIDYVYINNNEIPSSTIKFDKNYVLYSKLRPYLNKVVIPDRSGYGTSELIAIECNDKINKYYLAEGLRSKSFVDEINATSYGAKMPRASVDWLKNFNMPIPPIELQNDFASFVAQVDKSKFVVQEALNKTKMLMDSLMQEYFG